MIRDTRDFSKNIESANLIFRQYGEKLRWMIASEVNYKSTVDVNKKNNYCRRNKNYAQLHCDRGEVKGPEQIVQEQDECDRLFEIIEQILLPHEVKAVKERYKNELDTAEAAEQMDVSKRTYSHYMCSALKKIRKFFANKRDY